MEKETHIWIEDLERQLSFESSSSSSSSGTQDEEIVVSVFWVPSILADDEQSDKESTPKILSPEFMTVGPIHSRASASDQVLQEGNKIKREALCDILRVYTRSERDDVLKKLVKTITDKTPMIKKCYQYNFPKSESGEGFSRMIVEDCCFLLQAFSILSGKKKGKVDANLWPRLDLLNRRAGDHGGEKVLQDMVKLENQIPIWVIEEVADGLPGWEHTAHEISKQIEMEKVLSRLSPICSAKSTQNAASKWKKCYANKQCHLLHLLRSYVTEHVIDVGTPKMPSLVPFVTACLGGWNGNAVKAAVEKTYDSHGASLLARGRLQELLCISTPLILPAYCVLLVGSIVFDFMILLFLLPFFIISCIWGRPNKENSHDAKFRSLLYTPVNVVVTASQGGINSTTFTEFSRWGGKGTLQLPEVRLDDTTEVILRNMVALEIGTSGLKKTVSNYSTLMNEILQTPVAVAQLIQAGVIKSHKDARGIIRMWRSVRRSANRIYGLDPSDPAYRTLEKLDQLPKPSKLLILLMSKDLWLEDIKRRYGSNPWVTLSTAAALMLLILTATQVFCLFYHC